jgi:hypothetical protein
MVRRGRVHCNRREECRRQRPHRQIHLHPEGSESGPRRRVGRWCCVRAHRLQCRGWDRGLHFCGSRGARRRSSIRWCRFRPRNRSRRAADVGHVIDAGGAAEHFAARHGHAATMEAEAALPWSAVYIQSVAGLSCMAEQATGMSSTSGGRWPASMRATRQLGSSESRAAMTAPADPAPTTMKSNVSDMFTWCPCVW